MSDLSSLIARLEKAEGPSPVLDAAKALRKIVEGIDGTMNHGAWRDDHGRRLRDAPEWVALYNAVHDAEKVITPKTEENGKSEALLQSLADEIKGHKPFPAATDEYAAGYTDGRNDAWLVVQGAAEDAPGQDLSAGVEGYKHILHALDGHKTVVVDGSEEHPFGDEFEEGDIIERIPLFRASGRARALQQKGSSNG